MSSKPIDDQNNRYDTLLKIRDYSEEQFNKLIVYLNSGALVLTIGFVQNIITITESTKISLLIISWCLFIFSLLLILISHQTIVFSLDCEIKTKDKSSKFWDICTKVLNAFSVLSLIVGLIFFIIFISGEL